MTAADDYIRRVEEALMDLPWSVRRELVSDLRRHIAELPARTNLRSKLGTPENYAAELRLAAGLERRRGPIAFIRSFRPRNLVVAAVVVTALALVITGLAWVTTYQPLAFGGNSVYPAGGKLMRGAAQYNVPFRQGARFRAGISIVNNGRFTVRVLGISGEPPFDYLQLAHRHLTVSAPVPKNAVQSVRPDRTFRPLDLPPGEAMFLQLNGTYNARCRPVKNPVRGYDGGSQVFAGFDVRYTVLWRTRTVRIDFPDTVSIEFPDNENCFEDGS